MQNILILYSELQPYNIPVIKYLVASGYEVHIVKWDKKKLTPYQAPFITGVTYYNRSAYNAFQLYQLAEKICPSVIYVVGWMDKGYTRVTKQMKKKFATPVVAGCDTQWVGGRQWLNVLFSRFRHQKWYSHILVAGMRQYEYAHRLGFEPGKILSPMYSADVMLFEQVDIEIKTTAYPKQLLYVGRLAKEKNVLALLQAWRSISDHKGWNLRIVGDGPLKAELLEQSISSENISFRPFVNQPELIKEMQASGCFILPSIFEPWALVIHEAASAGLPILCTNACGASDQFVISSYNGFIFSHSVDEIKVGIERLFNLKVSELIQFSENSRALSKRISPEIVASAILSTIVS